MEKTVDVLTEQLVDPVKIVISSQLLLERLKAVSFCVGRDRHFPILQCIKIDVTIDCVTVTASDLFNTATTELVAESNGSICTCVQFDLIFKLLTTLSDQMLTFLIDPQTRKLFIETESGVYECPGYDPVDWPTPSPMDHQASVEIRADILCRALGEVLTFVSNDDIRPVLGGIFLEFESSELLICASDTQALGLRKISFFNGMTGSSKKAKHQLIISAKVAKALASIHKDNADKAVSLSFNSSFIYITGLPNGISILSQLIDGRYPAFLNSIPTQNPYRLIVNRSDFLLALNRIEPFSNTGTRRVRLQLALEGCVIFAEDLDNSKQARELIAANYIGNNLNISFSLSRLQHSLESFNGSEIRLELSALNRAGVVRDATASEEDANLVLLMPFSSVE
ncbi:DNA polymerase-3 subunit beta [Dyadobacter sp. BE34]|uniref:Beta sliding clamp n=1 Tax=Dyadobacter fermentans TaxID=94254 RepID=A0ABU1R615_9BACT|nr:MULTISPECIES: DNA polymerase III subunit beta [Dyadobacter]MDR6808849.1 DNA polymerase-3 subunit beta [Dyadobacter fermentans]MDR7046592.1 DNA polymerase-3 subunit beta [Dyadobacter sp. BE242]MDR7200905.1 DNA polymerase-3 subunit beta [Dyadobacter sp. BE34]MDR7218866.1 DNA polymerase-3 subunit beta [Dyadobacter sp. BE31]MDR7266795.1 DNA polymerase-3 subunit beta [Dyadobacter sp. BE32]